MTSNNRISKLLSKHTDGREVYQPVYNEFFADLFCGTVKNILEIGLGVGTGLEAWLNAFPSSKIYGIDIRTVVPKVDPRLIVREGDSAVNADVERFFAGIGHVAMDVIIDDADHQTTSQIATLENCLPHLSPKGIYVMEDTGPRAEDDPFIQDIRRVCKDDASVFVRPVSNLAGVVVIVRKPKQAEARTLK